MLLLALLAMSSSDEDEAGAIKRAQAAAMKASASAAAHRRSDSGPAVQSSDPNGELFRALPADMLASVSSGPRNTCVKDKLLEKCVHCANRPRDREACAYKIGAWDPPSVAGGSSETVSGGLAGTAGSSAGGEVQESERRARKSPAVFEPEEFWRRELPSAAARRGESDGAANSMQLASLEMAELERTLVAKLKAAEKRVEFFESKERRAQAEKRQKTMESFLASNSRGLPTRTAHFDTDLSQAKGYTEAELHRTFRRDVAAVETFIETRVSDPLKQLQLADAVDRRFHGIRTTLAAENLAARYVLESLQNFSATIYHRYNGRYPNNIRAAQQGAAAAIANSIPKGKLHVVSEATGFPVAVLSAGRERWQSWFDGDADQLVEFRGQEDAITHSPSALHPPPPALRRPPLKAACR